MSQIDISSLSAYLEQYTKNILRITAASIRDELAETASSSLVAFYEHYTPRYYKRHYYNFLEYSYKKYYSNPHGTVYRGGIELTPDVMKNIYTIDTEQVFDTVFAGFHGVASTHMYPEGTAHQFVPPRMSPSPMEIILNKQKNIKNNIQQYILKAQQLL